MKKQLIKLILELLNNVVDFLLRYLYGEQGGAVEPEEPQQPQKCLFPMDYLRITQKENTGSHKGSLAMDFGGKDTGKDTLYAPFDCKVVRQRPKANGELYIESLKPVKLADGSIDYVHLLFMHDNNTYNLKDGDILLQGDAFYKEGGMGGGNPNKFANHVHIEGGKGRWNNPKQFLNSQGTYICENQCELDKLFMLPHSTINLNDTEHRFKYEF